MDNYAKTPTAVVSIFRDSWKGCVSIPRNRKIKNRTNKKRINLRIFDFF